MMMKHFTHLCFSIFTPFNIIQEALQILISFPAFRRRRPLLCAGQQSLAVRTPLQVVRQAYTFCILYHQGLLVLMQHFKVVMMKQIFIFNRLIKQRMRVSNYVPMILTFEYFKGHTTSGIIESLDYLPVKRHILKTHTYL